jgi:uncharacterized phiE125 gp8 family phage protein
MSGLSLVAPAPDRPLSLAEAKEHLRIDGNDEDAAIEALIEAATQAARDVTGRELLHQTWRWTCDAFVDDSGSWWAGTLQRVRGAGSPDSIAVPRPPLASVASIVTYDADDTPSTFPAAAYLADTVSVPGRIVLRHGWQWPSNLRAANGIEITFVAGYGTRPSDVPMALRRGILALVAALFEGREGDLAIPPPAVQALWRPYRVARLP